MYEKGQMMGQFEEVSMHRCKVAGMIHSECMFATCFIQVHMYQHWHVKIRMSIYSP